MRPLTSYDITAIVLNIAGAAFRRLPSFSAPRRLTAVLPRLRYGLARASYFGRYMVAIAAYCFKYVAMRWRMWLRLASILARVSVYAVLMIPHFLLLLVSALLGGIAAAVLPKEFIVDYPGMEMRVNWDHLLSVLKHMFGR